MFHAVLDCLIFLRVGGGQCFLSCFVFCRGVFICNLT